MSAGLIAAPARIDAARYWACPNCGHRLAEIVGDRVRIERGNIVVTMAIRTEPDQTCHKCGQVSYVPIGCGKMMPSS